MLKVTLTAEDVARSEYIAGEYRVLFKHEHRTEPRRTVCVVDIKGESSADWGVSKGVALCHPGEKYNGEVGQRLALARALEGIWPRTPIQWGGRYDHEMLSRFKATRTMFWDAYWKRFRRGKALTLRERLLRAHGECCRCHGDGPPCEQRMCAACSMLHWTIGQGVMPGQKIDCWKCGFPACSKREARYAPRKKENPNE